MATEKAMCSACQAKYNEAEKNKKAVEDMQKQCDDINKDIDAVKTSFEENVKIDSGFLGDKSFECVDDNLSVLVAALKALYTQYEKEMADAEACAHLTEDSES